MKHIGWCLDRIQSVMDGFPKAVVEPADKIKARAILDEVEKLAHTVAQLIRHPKFRNYLQRLEDSPIEGIRLQAHEIDELYKQLRHTLYILDYYVKNLRDVIDNHPEQWEKKCDQVTLILYEKFGGERGELRKEFQVALHKKEELRQFVSVEEHLAEFLKW